MAMIYVMAGLKPEHPYVRKKKTVTFRKELTILPSPVPAPTIMGPCIYGHIVTDEHRDNFRRLYPDIESEQSMYPEGLVSIASIMVNHRMLSARTCEVYDQGEKHV